MMTRRLIFLAWLLIALPAFAQEPEIDAFSGFPKTGDWELVRANCIACHSMPDPPGSAAAGSGR